jgi:hypothetical protein
MKLLKIFIIFFLISIIFSSCSIFFSIGKVNLSKARKLFENIPNVKVLDIWERGDWGNYASAIILIDNEKLLVFDYFKEKSFKDNKGIVRIRRIANWDLVLNYYGYIGVSEIGGGDVKSSGWVDGLEFNKFDIFLKNNNLPEIKKIQDVIKNYDLILNVIDSLPEYSKELDNWCEYNDLEKDMIFWLKKERADPFIYDEENNTHNLSHIIKRY